MDNHQPSHEASPTLGMVLMDDDYAVEGSPAELQEATYSSPWAIQDPDSWPVPLHTAVASGAGVRALLAADSEALDSVVEATRRLDGTVDLIVGNCGFMGAGQPLLKASTVTPAMLSSMDMLELGLQMTGEPVGVITFDAPALNGLLADHPQRARVRLLGLEGLPDWQAINGPDFMERGGWSMDRLGKQLTGHLAQALAGGGEFEGVRVLILECACLVNFRDAIRSVTTLPVLDVASFARAALS